MQRKAENKWHGVIMAWVSWSGGIPKREKVGFSLHFEVRSWPGLDVSVDFYHFLVICDFILTLSRHTGKFFWGFFLGARYTPFHLTLFPRPCLLTMRHFSLLSPQKQVWQTSSGWGIFLGGFQVLNQRHYSRVSLNNDRKRLDSFLGAAPKVKWTPGEGDSIDTEVITTHILTNIQCYMLWKSS